MFLLTIALLGIASSTAFLGIALAGALKFRTEAARQKGAELSLTPGQWPPVSILKPLHGLDPQLRRNLQSFFQQDYSPFEILFAVDHPGDAALPVARELCQEYPTIPSKILITGEPAWPNPPAYAFAQMAAAAAHDLLVTSDSDVMVDPGYLRALVPPLLHPENGMSTCVYRGFNAGGFWSLLDAAGMSVEMTAGVLSANAMEGMKFGLGPTIAVRREALEAIGGYRVLGDYFSNDFVLGKMIAEHGYKVILSRYIIDHIVPPMTFRAMWQRQLRWATGTKHSRPKGHFGSVFTYSVPYGMLGLIGALWIGRPLLGVGILAFSVANRMVESVAIGWLITRDRNCLVKPWLAPLRDLLGFCVWVASYLSRNMRWRDGRFELVKGGKILVRDRDGSKLYKSGMG